jgi:nucleoside-diphosphate-sugar epimerase
MKKILITGSEGFIGKHLEKKLKDRGHDVVGVDLIHGQDLKSKEFVNSLDNNFDIIFHFAAYNGTKWFYEKPVQVIRDNVIATENILSKYSGKVEKIIFAGSCESYAGSVDYFNYNVPTDEKVPLAIIDPKNLRWSYGGSKLLNELMIWAYSKEYNQNMLVIRYHNVYGPGQKDHFIPEFIDRAQNNQFQLYGYKNTRSFIYIDDAVNITEQISFNTNSDNLTVNIGTNHEIQIIDAAKTILEVMRKDNNLINLNESPRGSVTRRCPDISVQNSFIGNEYKFINFKEGITKTINKL